jgi:acyl-CoA synthetase (AMP-forming)/AMP-acid ligase II
VVGARSRAEALARRLHELQALEPVREAIVTLPLTYSYAFVNQWVWSHVHGRRLTLTAGLTDAAALARSFAAADAALVCLVGAQLPRLVESLSEGYPGVVRVCFAGGAFPQDRLADVRRLFPAATVLNNYGCAEAMPRLTLRRADEAEDGANVGRALPGVSLRIGEGHEVLFRSEYGALAFVDDAGFHPLAAHDWVSSGDLGELLADGSLRLLGRANEVFKRYGEKVALPQLATTVREAWRGQVAFYRERDRAEEEGYVLVLAPRAEEADVRAILRLFRARHPRACWPLRIESVTALALSANGKPDAATLPSSSDKAVHWQQGL